MEELVTLETRAQTIYYEDSAGNIEKYHHVDKQRLSNNEAEDLLIEKGINVNIVLRVLTERIDVQLTREEFQEKIVFSERFYQRKK